jgi:hypothetical protein
LGDKKPFYYNLDYDQITGEIFSEGWVGNERDIPDNLKLTNRFIELIRLRKTLVNHDHIVEDYIINSITNEMYLQLINDIYKSSDNFLVKKPISIPIDINEYYTPFTILNKNEIKNYIQSSDYWARSLLYT